MFIKRSPNLPVLKDFDTSAKRNAPCVTLPPSNANDSELLAITDEN